MIKLSDFWGLLIVHMGMPQKADIKVGINTEKAGNHFCHSLYHEGTSAPKVAVVLVIHWGLSLGLWAIPELMQTHKPSCSYLFPS